MRRMFRPKSKREELELLRNDDVELTATTRYLSPLVDDALDRFAFTTTDRAALRAELLRSVAVAVEKYITHPNNLIAPYTFATYFTWYVSRGIDRYFHLRRKA